jgi:hypothetical protein
MDMENLLMELVMNSARRDRLDDPHPHREERVEQGRRPKLRSRRRSQLETERVEPVISWPARLIRSLRRAK